MISTKRTIYIDVAAILAAASATLPAVDVGGFGAGARLAMTLIRHRDGVVASNRGRGMIRERDGCVRVGGIVACLGRARTTPFVAAACACGRDFEGAVVAVA
jgi:hypothetical protein